MKDGQFNDDPQDLRLDDDDPVWRLLGESPRPKPDAWFTVRTLARCRSAMQGVELRGFSFFGAWRWALGTGLGLCLAVVLLMSQMHPSSVGLEKEKNLQEAFNIVASLNSSDADSASFSSWQDSSSLQTP